MNRIIYLIMAGTLVLAVTAGCQTMGGGQRGGPQVADEEIMGNVKSKLVAEPVSGLSLVDVLAENGTVYLHGQVQSPEVKARAEELAWQVAGVKDVVNNLQIGAGSQPSFSP